jgi:hypothetical protein
LDERCNYLIVLKLQSISLNLWIFQDSMNIYKINCLRLILIGDKKVMKYCESGLTRNWYNSSLGRSTSILKIWNSHNAYSQLGISTKLLEE